MAILNAGHESPRGLVPGNPTMILHELTSDRVGIPAELKHINKRRTRNQQGLPQ